MASFDDLFHRMRCSLHPQLRHYSPESLKDPYEFRYQLDYWNIPESFRRECDAAFQATGTTGYYTWKSKCVFSFNSLTPPSAHAVLLRNIFVPKEHRGKHYCTEALSQIARIAECSATCILAIVNPFEMCSEAHGTEAAIDALHRSLHGIWYVSDETAKQAMHGRLKKAGFRTCDLRGITPYLGNNVPVGDQWIFVPDSVDQSFLADISSLLVNEGVDDSRMKQTAIECG